MRRILLSLLLAVSAGAQTVVIGPAAFGGAGLNDASSAGRYTPAASNALYVVTISATGSPDHFTWTKNGGTASSPVAIVSGAIALADGVTITFAATTGHALAASWTITAQASGSVSGTSIQRGVGAVFEQQQEIDRRITYAEDFGAAIGTDSTAAWQRLLDTVKGTINNLYVAVKNPAVNSACYLLSSPLVFGVGNPNPGALMIEGQMQANGASGPCFQATGSFSGKMLTILNAPLSTIKNIAFNGAGLATVGIEIDTDRDVNPGNSTIYGVELENLGIGGMVSAPGSADIQIAHGSCGSSPGDSEVHMRHLFLTGDYTTNITGVNVLCGGNVKNFSVDDTYTLGVGTGISYSAGGNGWFNLRGNEFLDNAGPDISIGSGVQADISGNGSEGGFLFLACGGGTVPAQITLKSNYWAGIAGTTAGSVDDVIDIGTGCNVDSSNNNLSNNRTGSSPPNVYMANPTPVAGGANSSFKSFGDWFQFATNVYSTPFTGWPFWDHAGDPIGVYDQGQAYGFLNTPISVEIMGDQGGTLISTTPLSTYSPFSVRIFTPASFSTTPCIPPQMTYDSSFGYICIANHTWLSWALGSAGGSFVTTNTTQTISGTKEFSSTSGTLFDSYIVLDSTPSAPVAGNVYLPSGGQITATNFEAGYFEPADSSGNASVSGEGYLSLGTHDFSTGAFFEQVHIANHSGSPGSIEFIDPVIFDAGCTGAGCGVSSIVAGTDISISPGTGLGAVTINNTAPFGGLSGGASCSGGNPHVTAVTVSGSIVTVNCGP
jgi:hypothetical protein